jgi:hypothetical protein
LECPVLLKTYTLHGHKLRFLKQSDRIAEEILPRRYPVVFMHSGVRNLEACVSVSKEEKGEANNAFGSEATRGKFLLPECPALLRSYKNSEGALLIRRRHILQWHGIWELESCLLAGL